MFRIVGVLTQKLTRHQGEELLKVLAGLDEEVISVGPVFSNLGFSSLGAVKNDELERLFTMEVNAENGQKALEHVRRCYCLLLKDCYYSPPAEPAH